MRNLTKNIFLCMSIAFFSACNDDDVKEKNKNKKPLKTDLAPAPVDEPGGAVGSDNASIVGNRTLITDPSQLFLQTSIIVNKAPVQRTKFIFDGAKANITVLKPENWTGTNINSEGSSQLDILLASNVWHKLLMDKNFLGMDWDIYYHNEGEAPENSKLHSQSLTKPVPFQWKVFEGDQNIFYYQYGIELRDIKTFDDNVLSQGYVVAMQALTIFLKDSEDENSPVMYISIPVNLQ